MSINEECVWNDEIKEHEIIVLLSWIFKIILQRVLSIIFMFLILTVTVHHGRKMPKILKKLNCVFSENLPVKKVLQEYQLTNQVYFLAVIFHWHLCKVKSWPFATVKLGSCMSVHSYGQDPLLNVTSLLHISSRLGQI